MKSSMNDIGCLGAVDGPVVSEGGRAKGAGGRPRQRRTRRGHAADRRAQHGGRAAAREDGPDQRPFGPEEVAVLAATVSPATGRHYGVARVCQVWDVPRSSFYAARQAAAGP